MATLINNAGVQHYANKMVLAENRKVGSKSLPTALADIDNLIDEMKTQFDTEYGSALDMKLENNENVFIVGTGADVDKGNEVENSFTDVELSGNSLVNCVLIDKLYEDSNYLEFENSPVITEGNITLKSRQLNHVRFCPKIECGVIKPNTKYTLIFNVTSNNLTGRTNLTHTNTDTTISAFPFTNTIQPKQTGIFKYVLTSIADISSCNTLLRTIIWNDCITEGETITFSLMILEGDWTNKPLPQHFEGLKSIGEKEDGNHKISILSCARNLLDISKFSNVDNHKSTPTTILSSFENCYLVPNTKPNTKYTLYRKSNVAGTVNVSLLNSIGGRVSLTAGTHVKREIQTSDDGKLYIGIQFVTQEKINTALLETQQLWLFENEISDKPYEPYREDKKEISLNEPLRSLPKSTMDTIEKINGEWKIIRRCGEVIFNGSEDWIGSSQYNGEKTCYFRTDSVKDAITFPQDSKRYISDRFISENNAYNPTQYDYECIAGTEYNGVTNRFMIRIDKSKLSSQDVAGFKEWLSQNPTKVVYELATPIIEDVSPVTLQCWKNGTISIDEVLPVETTHTVALNKPAQIKRNIEELTALRKRVKKLEEMYDDIALEQAYKLSLINFNFELDYN